MSFLPYRHILRTLNREQRRRWAEMKARFPQPRVSISIAAVPQSIARQYTHVKVG